MRLVVVSDTHGDKQILRMIAKQQQPDADGCFYCGDSELPADDEIFETYQPVTGNMDFDPAFPLTRTADFPGLKVFMTHGHRFNVNWTLDVLIQAGREAHADLVLFGHTHQLGVEQHDHMIVLNPGSISQPRGEFAPLHGTYATVDFDDKTITVQFHTRDGQVVDKLTRTFTR